MSESLQEIEHQNDKQAVASAGQLLAVARESAGLTVEEAATRLRLSVRQVLALEADETSALPGDTFVRGFIRNYAKLLGLDAAPLLAAYRVSVPDTGALTISLHSENIPIISHDKKIWKPYMLATVIVGLALGGWMIYMEYAVNDRHKVVAEKVVTEKPLPPVPVAPEMAAPMLLQAPLATPIPPEMQAAESATAPIPPTAARLVMTFVEQSWVSVTDRDGKQLFNKSQPAGSEGATEGSPPFNIVIGNATGVRLTYNDKPVDLAPYTKANVARLTLE